MNFLKKTQIFISRINNNKDKIIEILTKIETYETAKDEIKRSIKCLSGIERQKKFLTTEKVELIASYLPLNQPLYSLVLFVLVPSMISKNIAFRSPVLLSYVYSELFNIIISVEEKVTLCLISRRDFFKKFTKNADVIIFTGLYDNALKLLQKIKNDSLFLFNGSALNPIVVTETADLDKAAHDVVRERLFNSGQDCMAPCAIFVNSKVINDFLFYVGQNLKLYKVGNTADREIDVGQMLEYYSIEFAEKYYTCYKNNIVYGGGIIKERKIIEPTVILFDSPEQVPQTLIFAPILLVSKYDIIKDIEAYLNTEEALALSGYISIYTKSESTSNFELYNLKLLTNKSLFDYEDGNTEFGGYGMKCSFVYYNGKIIAKPILISNEIARYTKALKEKKSGGI